MGNGTKVALVALLILMVVVIARFVRNDAEDPKQTVTAANSPSGAGSKGVAPSPASKAGTITPSGGTRPITPPSGAVGSGSSTGQGQLATAGTAGAQGGASPTAPRVALNPQVRGPESAASTAPQGPGAATAPAAPAGGGSTASGAPPAPAASPANGATLSTAQPPAGAQPGTGQGSLAPPVVVRPSGPTTVPPVPPAGTSPVDRAPGAAPGGTSVGTGMRPPNALLGGGGTLPPAGGSNEKISPIRSELPRSGVPVKPGDLAPGPEAPAAGNSTRSGGDVAAEGEGKQGTRSHTVQAGESYWGLAQKYYHDGNRLGIIQKANANARLIAGKVIVIPDLPATEGAAGSTPGSKRGGASGGGAARAPSAGGGPGAGRAARSGEAVGDNADDKDLTPIERIARSSQRTASPQGRETAKVAGASFKTGAEKYKVKKGDTLQRIAKRFYNDPNKYYLIEDANEGLKYAVLQEGATIQIPALESR